MEKKGNYTFKELCEVISRLRKECPWDSIQTHESLKESLVNETQEVLEGIDILKNTGDGSNLCEELGDVLMLVLLQCEIARDQGEFTLEDVINGIARKMVYRHPRIFSPEDKEACSLSWNELKKREKNSQKPL